MNTSRLPHRSVSRPVLPRTLIPPMLAGLGLFVSLPGTGHGGWITADNPDTAVLTKKTYYDGIVKKWTYVCDPFEVSEFQLTVTFDPARASLASVEGKFPFNFTLTILPDPSQIQISGSLLPSENTRPGDVDLFKLTFDDLNPGQPIDNVFFTTSGVGANGDFVRAINPVTFEIRTYDASRIVPAIGRAILGETPMTWDPTGVYDDGNLGGPGSWDTTGVKWDSLAASPPLRAWNNTTNAHDLAVFSGNPGTGGVVIAGTIAVGALQFDISGYNLQGGGTLVLNDGRVEVVQSASATISAVLAGSSGLNLTGGGTLVLSGANTYSGFTAVNAGALNIQNANALGSTASGTTVVAGAALLIQGGITTAVEALTLNGMGVANDGALRNTSGANNYAGLVTLGSATRINSDAGTLTISNVGAITGATFGLTVGGAGNTTINSSIGTTSGTLTKDGTGTLTLTGASTYTGPTIIKRGTLKVVGATGGSLNAVSPLTLAGNGTFAYESGGIASQTLGALSFQSGDGTVRLVSPSTGVRQLTFASLAARTPGATGNFGFASGTISNVLAFTGAPAVGFIDQGLFFNDFNYAVIVPGGSVSFMAHGSTPFTVPADTIQADRHIYLGLTPAAQNTISVRTITFQGNASFPLAAGQTLTLSNGGILKHSNGTTTFSGGAGITTGGATELVVQTALVGDTVSIATPILNTSTGGLTKSGPGTLILSASNGYSGQTTVNRGKLLVNGSETSPVTIGVDATLGGFGSVGAISGAGTVSPGASAGILTAPSIDPSQNLGFRFEITQAAPNFANAAASGNDVLRLTGPNPFGLGLSVTNKILFDFQIPVLTNGAAFIGGFFTDSNTDYSELIRGAAIVATLNGGQVPEGLEVVFDQMVPETMDFGAGPVVGRALQIHVIPEPGTVGLLLIGALGLLRRGRRLGD